MSNRSQYYSVVRAQWQHIGFSDVHKIRTELANENKEKQEVQSTENVQIKKRELIDQD